MADFVFYIWQHKSSRDDIFFPQAGPLHIQVYIMIESVSFSKVFSVIAAFLQSIQIFIMMLCIFLSAIIVHVNLVGPQHRQEQEPQAAAFMQHLTFTCICSTSSLHAAAYQLQHSH